MARNLVPCAGMLYAVHSNWLRELVVAGVQLRCAAQMLHADVVVTGAVPCGIAERVCCCYST